MIIISMLLFFFFFQAEDGIRDVAVTGVQTCALPISPCRLGSHRTALARRHIRLTERCNAACRSEEHTSELQSRLHLVCRLLLEKKKKNKKKITKIKKKKNNNKD